jgi:hypothetical protein
MTTQQFSGILFMMVFFNLVLFVTSLLGIYNQSLGIKNSAIFLGIIVSALDLVLLISTIV